MLISLGSLFSLTITSFALVPQILFHDIYEEVESLGLGHLASDGAESASLQTSFRVRATDC